VSPIEAAANGVIAKLGHVIIGFGQTKWKRAMPILTELSDEADWVEPDDVPRAVVTYGFIAKDFGGLELEPHRHRKGQVVLVQSGALSCEVEGGLWIVPPRSAVWIPGSALHSIKVSGTLEGYGAFIDPQLTADLPKRCCAVSVTPLLRELLTRAAHLPMLYEESGANARLLAVLLDELAAAKIEQLHLPMPHDHRLRRIVEAIIAAPADRGTIDVWAKRAWPCPPLGPRQPVRVHQRHQTPRRSRYRALRRQRRRQL